MSKENLVLHGSVELAQGSTGNRFKIKAYTGAPVERAWGKMCIDVTGITSKAQMPVLMNHDSKSIVGHSLKSFVQGNSFYVEGQFSSVTKEGQQAKKLAAEGFPWQASVGIRPLETLNVAAGKSHVVNGQSIPGPVEVWLKSEVLETSLVPLGADDSTSVETFGGDNMKSQAKLKWNSDPALQAEFFGDFEAFEAYENAITVGNVKFVQGAPCKTFSREDAIADEPAETMSPAQGDDAWNVDPAIKEEFGDKETYEAFLKAEAGNKFKVLNH